MLDLTASNPRRGRWIGLTITILVSGFVFWTYHNRFWYPPDEGNYAHVAQRVLDGEVLNRDVHDPHMGFVHFVNAGCLWMFGESLLSLRYPLIAIGVLSAAVAFWLTCREDIYRGIAAGLIVTTLSIVQFLNPTAHWYCFGLMWVVIACLTWWPAASSGRLLVVGFVVGLIVLFRQLTGVLVAMGVLVCLLQETDASPQGPGRHVARVWPARLLCGIMFCGLLGYLLTKTDGFTLAMYGSWPLAVLALVGWRTRITAGRLLKILGSLGTGAAAAAAPLVIYHVAHGSAADWLADTTVSAESLTRLDFMHKVSFPLVLAAAWVKLLSGGGLAGLLNALFWIAALSAAPILGICFLNAVHHADDSSLHRSPLIVLAVFYSVVSLHYQAPVYLFYSLSLTLVALMQIASLWPEWRNAVTVALVTLAVIGLRYHAAQPLTRELDELLGGVRADRYVASSNSRCGLAIPAEDEAVYTRACSLIEKHCTADDSILALPSDAELYFLSGRRNPFPFCNSALGLADADDVRSAIARLEAFPPELVFFRPEDKYNTAESLALMDWVRRTYTPLPPIGEFEVYERSTETRRVSDGLALRP